MNSKILTRAVLALALTVGGCSANYNTAFRDVSIDPEPNALVMDAKQRAILSADIPLGTDGNPDPNLIRRFCSEPSPDVFSVVAQSLGLGGSFGQSGDPASIEAALNLAFSTAEQGSTISRTQTTNTIREMMFRTCERYLSGGYDEIELSVQASRDQSIMVSVLAIEQLTGAVAPRPTIIGATGSAGSGATGEAIVRVDDARRRVEKARADFQAASSTYDTVNGDDKVCDAIDGKDEADLTDDQKTKVEPCKEAKNKRDTAKSEQTAAEAAYQQISEMARTGGVSAQTTVSAGPTGGLDRAHSQAVASVAQAVESIVALNVSDSSNNLLFCYRILREGRGNVDPAEYAETADLCREIILRNYDEQSQRLNQLTDLETLTQDQAERSMTRFDLYWAANSAKFGDAASRAAEAQRIQGMLGLGDRAKAQCFANATNKQAAGVCFNQLSNRVTLRLSQGN